MFYVFVVAKIRKYLFSWELYFLSLWMIKKVEIQKRYSDFSKATQKLIRERINTPARILILSHKNPDGDALGSSLGLKSVLESLGHQVKVFIPDMAPDSIKWLPGYENVGVFERSPKSFPGFIEDPEIVFFLDFNNPDRLGDMGELLKSLNGLKILIDHHPANDPFFDIAIRDTSRGSTCEMIFLLLEDLGFLDRLNENAATCLYTGIITDTLGLQVSSSYSEIYRIVGHLVEAGIVIEDVFNNIYHQFSLSRMQLLGYCLVNKLKLLPEHEVAYIWLTQEELARFNHIKGDTEGFVNYPLSIKNIRFTVLFTELDGEVKLSLRSKGNIPVNEFASQYFNGGGHRNAAGGRSQLSMEEALEYFEDNVKKFMER